MSINWPCRLLFSRSFPFCFWRLLCIWFWPCLWPRALWSNLDVASVPVCRPLFLLPTNPKAYKFLGPFYLNSSCSSFGAPFRQRVALRPGFVNVIDNNNWQSPRELKWPCSQLSLAKLLCSCSLSLSSRRTGGTPKKKKIRLTNGFGNTIFVVASGFAIRNSQNNRWNYRLWVL